MTEDIKYCTIMMKKNFNKKLAMAKEDDADFEKSTKYWIFDKAYADSDFKVRNHCYITGNIEGRYMQIVISTLNQIIKFLSNSKT